MTVSNSRTFLTFVGTIATLALLSAGLCGPAESRFCGVIAHRGVVQQAPENTLPAIQKAIDLGCAMAEIDLRYTSDGEVILMHDATLERTTNGRGLVSALNLAQLQLLDAGAHFEKSFAGARVATLREAIELARGKIQLYLDLKEDDPQPVARVVAELNAQEMVYFRPYTFRALKEIVAYNPKFRVLIDLGDWVQAPGMMAMLKREFPTSAFSSDWKNWNQKMVDEARRLRTLTFVNVLGPDDTPDNLRRAVDMGFDYIQTDNQQWILEILKNRSNG